MRPRILLSLAVFSLINLTYVDGLAPDFSDLALEAVTENGTYQLPFSVLEYEEGAWALVNASVPEENYTLILSASSAGGEDSPAVLNISYQEGLSPDFSNLHIQFTGPDGGALDAGFAITELKEGQYALVELERAPLENETISILADTLPAPPDLDGNVSGLGEPSGTMESPDLQMAAPAASPAGKAKMRDLWPLKKGNRWAFEDSAGSISFELLLDDCGKDCFRMDQDSPNGAASIGLLIIGETIYELDQGGRRERMPLFSTNSVDWEDGNSTITIRSEPGSGELDGQVVGCTRIIRHVEAGLPDGAGTASASFEACFAENYGPIWIIRPDGSVHGVLSYEVT